MRRAPTVATPRTSRSRSTSSGSVHPASPRGLGPSQRARTEAFFARHGGKALVLGRFTGFLRATMPFVAGTSGVTLRRLLPFSTASGLAWTATFTLLGYGFANTFAHAGDTATRIGLVLVLVVTAA